MITAHLGYSAKNPISLGGFRGRPRKVDLHLLNQRRRKVHCGPQERTVMLR
jgi:hypothetical protein